MPDNMPNDTKTQYQTGKNIFGNVCGNVFGKNQRMQSENGENREREAVIHKKIIHAGKDFIYDILYFPVLQGRNFLRRWIIFF